MDPVRNPFAPGAGTQPPELAGRQQVVESATLALARVKGGRAARSQLLLGLRGVGKTVLLNRIGQLAEGAGYQRIVVEAPEERRLAEILVPPLRSALFSLSGREKAKAAARHALGVLRAFASAFKVKVGEVEFEVKAEKGTADSGNLEFDLPELLIAVARAGKAAESAIGLFIDEVQYLGEEDLAALIVALHRISQEGLPFVVFGAGLPQLAALAGDAKSYAERLFEYPDIGPLEDEAASDAIEAPLRREGVEIESAALARIISQTRGYPYFVQEWGFHCWNVAEGRSITEGDVMTATEKAIHELDEGFFRVRLDRLTPREKRYMRAMAHLGPGPHRSGDIAHELGVEVTSVAPLRSGLIRKGMIYSPHHGDTAFTVPMFDEFMHRSIPEWPQKPQS